MSEKRKIDDADLTEIAGAGEPVPSDKELKPAPPPGGGGPTDPPDTDDRDGGEQDFGL